MFYKKDEAGFSRTCVIYPTSLFCALMRYVNGLRKQENGKHSVSSDWIAPSEYSDLGLHCSDLSVPIIRLNMVDL